MHAGACSKLPKYVRPPASACEMQDPVHTAMEDRKRRLPLLRKQPLERRQDAVEGLAERLAAEKPRRLVGGVQRADEERLELVTRHIVEPAAAPLGELGPPRRLVRRRHQRRRLDRARQRARHDSVELHVGKRPTGGGCLLMPAVGEQHDLRVSLADIRDLRVPHQIEPPPHPA